MNWICKQKRWISIGCFLITCVFVVFGYQSGIFTDTQKMQAFLERAGVLAPLVFMAIQAVQVVIPILPGAIGCVFGVVFFGAVKGFFYNYIGICIGSVAAFLLAELLHSLCCLRIHELLRIEILNLCCQLCLVICRVKIGDRCNTDFLFL